MTLAPFLKTEGGIFYQSGGHISAGMPQWRKGGGRLDWPDIKNEYIHGGISYRGLAKKHGVSKNTLFKKAKAEGWTRLRDTYMAERQQKTTEAMLQHDVEQVSMIFEASKTILEKIMERAKDCEKPQDLKTLTSALKDIKDIQAGNTMEEGGTGIVLIPPVEEEKNE